MKAFASILLLLASSQAAGRSTKAVKQDTASMSIELLGAEPEASGTASMSIEFLGAKSAKGSKAAKEPIRRQLIYQAEHRTLQSSSEHSMAYVLFSGKSAKCGKSAKNAKNAKNSKCGKGFNPKGGKGRFLDVDSEDLVASMSIELLPEMSVELVPETAAIDSKSGKGGKASKVEKGSVAPAPRSIDPTISNDSEPLKAISYIDYSRAQAPEEAAETSSGSMSVASLLAVALPLAVSAAF